jgi:aminoglycoside phosphotransferase (APT) family kinase protein
MTTLARRDDAELARGFTDWCTRQWPDAGYEIADLARPRSGWTNETLLVALHGNAGDRRLVVRLPPGVPTWPVYDLDAQARVLAALGTTTIPVPAVVAYEPDDQWLGAPFVVMSHEAGRPGPEAPALEAWVMESAPETQRRLHENFIDMLAAINSVDWHTDDIAGALRGGERALTDEVAWWADYVDWASAGAPTAALADAMAWCAQNTPITEPPASLCWGDVRIGNMLFSEERAVMSVLDWEMASIGPAELDLAWFVALDELTNYFVKKTVPGFLTRAEVVARYEAALGRAVVDLEWHEIFALIRSTAINDRQARLAQESGVPYPGIAGDDNPVLRVIARRIENFGTANIG